MSSEASLPPEHMVDCPMISVIIPTYNAAHTLGLQLSALAAQLAPPTFEVLIVDNRSTDDTQEVAQSFADQFPRLRVITATGEAGAAYARNVGAAAAHGQYLMFCDADDVVASRWIQYGQRDFAAADLWTGSAIPSDQTSVRQSLPEIWQHIDDIEEEARLDFTENAVAAPILCGGCFGITRAHFLDIGGFDQSFGSAGEDNELAWRLTQGGSPLPVSKTVKIAYQTSPNLQVTLKKTQDAARSMVLLSRRYDSPTKYSSLRWAISNAARAFLILLRTKISRTQGAEITAPARQRLAASFGAISGIRRYRKTVPEARLGHGFHEGFTQRDCGKPADDSHTAEDKE